MEHYTVTGADLPALPSGTTPSTHDGMTVSCVTVPQRHVSMCHGHPARAILNYGPSQAQQNITNGATGDTDRKQGEWGRNQDIASASDKIKIE